MRSGKPSIIETHKPLFPFVLQERLIGEIDKLRNEIDHLKRRSGVFGDGTHPRYTLLYIPDWCPQARMKQHDDY